MKRSRLVLVGLLGLALAVAPGAFAQDKWITTGSSLRVKSLGLFTVKVYSITHLMKERPKDRSKRGIIEADVDKQFVMYFKRDVGADKIKDAFRDGFKKNGYGTVRGSPEAGKVERFVSAVGTGDVVEYDAKKDKRPSITIAYHAATKTTSIDVVGHGSAKIEGDDFMRATWSIWYGRIDQPAMGDQLMASLPKD